MPSLPRLLLAAGLSAALVLDEGSAAASPGRSLDLRSVRVTGEAAFAPSGSQGKKVRLTLDPQLQRAAAELLSRAGAPEAAIVASDVRTGRILAWASRGARDFVASPYAPSASLFKIVTATALLEEGKATPATTECYSGGMHSISARDLDTRGSTCTPLGEALGRSINVVFAKLAKKHLFAGDLHRFARELGFDGKVPIDVSVGASTAEIPDDPLGLARAAAGFWNGHVSPLGALFAMQTIANEGEKIRFSILDQGEPSRVSVGRAMEPSVARTLTRMLEVTTRRGTCAKVFHENGRKALPGIPVAAKTGTLVGGSPSRMFSWFAAFAPSNRPEIAVVVMLANDVKWRTKANIVGRDFLETYFEGGRNARARASKASPGRVRSKSR